MDLIINSKAYVKEIEKMNLAQTVKDFLCSLIFNFKNSSTPLPISHKQLVELRNYLIDKTLIYCIRFSENEPVREIKYYLEPMVYMNKNDFFIYLVQIVNPNEGTNVWLKSINL